MKKLITLFSLLLISGILNLLHAQQKDSIKVPIIIPPSLDTSLISKPDTSHMLLSQEQGSIQVPQIIPPSPDAAGLGKYGNFPVGLNTGIPEISIPIYTIKTSKLELPISLSYHASGIKVAEFASWIGLGWSLNAGGVISRSVVGIPDDASGFLSRSDIKNASQLTNNNYEYMGLIANGLEDGESDFYFYNFNGHAGKFVFPQNSRTPFLIPKAPIKIVYSTGQFVVTDEMGVIYKFNSNEYSHCYIHEMLHDFISSYYLTEIISADGKDHITFTYQQEDGYAENNYRYTEIIGQQCTRPGPPVNNYHSSSYVNDSRGINPIILKEINFATGKVEFIKDASRLDAPKSRLDTIKISEKNPNGTFTLRKKISLGEAYFVTQGGGTTDLNRLKLTGITDYDVQNNAIKKYSFYYNVSEMLPPRNSLAQDWWGFYNGQGNSSLIKYETINFEGFNFQVGGANREPDATKMKVGVLDSIIFPTGGSTKFLYEPNYYGTTSNIMAGALRVKEIRDYEGPGKIPIIKIYKYGTSESGRGTLLIPTYGIANSKQTYNFEWWYSTGSACIVGCSGRRMTITGGTSLDLTSLNGAPVVYPEVTVYENNSSTRPNGKKVYKFSVYPDQFMGVDQAYNNGEYQTNESWKGSDEKYNASFLQDTTKKSEANYNTYSFLSNPNIIGTKIGWKITREGCPMPPLVISTDYYYFDYPIYSGIKKLTYNINRQYSSSDANYVETQVSYGYQNLSDQHQQLTNKTMINSTGVTDSTRYWYPADYNSATIPIIDTLKRKNIIAIPIKEENYSSNKITAGKVIQYNNFGNPLEIDLFETAQPQTPPTRDPNVLLPPGYLNRATMAYNANQNLQSFQRSDDIKIFYIWGYFNNYPVAKIENASLQEVQTALGGSIPDLGGGGLSTAQINSLRSGLPKALITTYSYYPLMGLKSITDPNSVTTTYEYDYFGRLKWIKDSDGRILKTFEYHYKQ